MAGYYFFVGSNLEKYGKFCFSGRIWPDWGNTAWADMAGLGSIGLIYFLIPLSNRCYCFLYSAYDYTDLRECLQSADCRPKSIPV